jgi:hypothetical protein
MPEINAFSFMLFITWWSLLNLVMIAECSLGVVLLPKLAKWQVLLAAAGLALPLYFLFLHRGAADRIAAQFEHESPRKRCLHGMIAFCYFVISFALLPVLGNH